MRFLSKQGQLQPHSHSKAGKLSTHILNGLLIVFSKYGMRAMIANDSFLAKGFKYNGNDFVEPTLLAEYFEHKNLAQRLSSP